MLSGDDNLTLDLIRMGGHGVISVIANLEPGRMVRMVRLALDGRTKEAEKLNAELAPLMAAEFIETNPIPIKAMLAMKGMIKETYRLPLCELRSENRKKVEKVLKETGVLRQ